MNKEQELIEKAKKLYPVGTKFIDIWENEEVICDDNLSNPYKNGWVTEEYIVIYCKDKSGNKIIGRGKYLYKSGNWAKVLEYPKNYVAPSENLLSKLEIW